ncbi:MAG TPA: transcriptional regulator [Allosphingosinicella sp.]|nr:transcriptional regulator [Allosphingosinicella sp.]
MAAPLPDEIDDIVHGRVRLSILAFLSTAHRAEFTLLRKRLAISDGNLSLHLKKLEAAGYVALEKDFANRRPRTTVVLTEEGRASLVKYVEGIRALIKSIG